MDELPRRSSWLAVRWASQVLFFSADALTTIGIACGSPRFVPMRSATRRSHDSVLRVSRSPRTASTERSRSALVSNSSSRTPPSRYSSPVERAHPDEAYELLGERLAPDAPDVLDSNWPEHKVWWAVEVPAGLGTGDRFLIGGGMGLRAEAEVHTRDGESGAVIVVGPFGMDSTRGTSPLLSMPSDSPRNPRTEAHNVLLDLTAAQRPTVSPTARSIPQ